MEGSSKQDRPTGNPTQRSVAALRWALENSEQVLGRVAGKKGRLEESGPLGAGHGESKS
jgi:hypothetical protein